MFDEPLEETFEEAAAVIVVAVLPRDESVIFFGPDSGVIGSSVKDGTRADVEATVDFGGWYWVFRRPSAGEAFGKTCCGRLVGFIGGFLVA